MGQFDYINKTYGTDHKRGDRIRMDGRPGTITSASGAHIMVRFDGLKHSSPCHPTWEITKEYAPTCKNQGGDVDHLGGCLVCNSEQGEACYAKEGG